MKAILSVLLLVILLGDIRAQKLDSLQNQTNYRKAWDAATANGKISQEERVLLNIMVESLLLSVDSSSAWEQRWTPPQFNKPLDQSGRWPLVLQNIVIGSGLYGWGIPYVLHAEDGRWFVGGVMVSAGSAFYLTYKYTKDMEMTHARTQMMRYGSLVGFRYGLGLNHVLDLYNDDGSEDGETLWAWILMASVPAGHYGGELLFDKYEPTNGQAWAWTMWTGVTGLTTRLVYSVVNEAPDLNRDEDIERLETWERTQTLAELFLYPLGVYAGYRLSHDKQYSFGDALMLVQGWGYGFFNTMMLQSLFFENGDDNVFFMVSSFGAIGGAFAYDSWIQNDDFTFGQSTLMLLGSASGTAFGFGTAILFDLTNKEPLLTLALAGYGTGTWLTRKILDVKADGSLAEQTSTRVSLSPTIFPSLRPDEKVALIPGIDLRITFK